MFLERLLPESYPFHIFVLVSETDRRYEKQSGRGSYRDEREIRWSQESGGTIAEVTAQQAPARGRCYWKRDSWERQEDLRPV